MTTTTPTTPTAAPESAACSATAAGPVIGPFTPAQPPELVEVAIRHTDRIVRVSTGETTACPHLVVVPCVESAPVGRSAAGGSGFTGGFTAVHVPTGRVLPVRELLWHDLGPAAVARAVRDVAHLDWSSPDPQRYRAGHNRQAWLDAVRAVAADFDDDPDDYDPDHDHEDGPDSGAGEERT